MAVQNAKFGIEGSTLYIEIDLSESIGISKSGKSENIAIVFPPEHVDYAKRPGLRFNLTVSADPIKKPAPTRQRMSK